MINFKSKTTLFAITSIIVASFALSGLFSNTQQMMDFSNDNVGWVGKKPIKNIEFLRYKEVLRLEDPNIKNIDILKKIGDRKALVEYSKNILNLTISDEEVINAIKEDSKFKEDGVFSKELYSAQLKQINFTPNMYEENVRDNLLLERLMSLTTIQNKSEKSIKYITESLFKVLNIDLYEVNYKNQVIKDLPRDLIEETYNNFQDLFYTKKQYKIKVKSYKKDENYYIEKFNNYKKNPILIYDLDQILVTSQKDLEKVLELLKSEDFDKVKKEYSIEKSELAKTVRWMKEDELTDEFKIGLNGIENGEYFSVKSSIGYHIVRKINQIDENISLEDYKEYFKNDLDKEFYEEVSNNTNENYTESFVNFEDYVVNDLFEKVEIGSETIVGEDNFLEKLTIEDIINSKKLDIMNEDDYKEIELMVKDQIKLENARRMAFNIEKIYKEEKPNWITMKNIDVNRNSKLPRELLDVIYITEIGQMSDFYLNGKYYLFKINEEKDFKIDNENFKKVIDYMYNVESGYILLNEARAIYPIKASSKILEEDKEE